MFPRKAPLLARESDGGLILHDQQTGGVHQLNAVAGVIWQLCDGVRDAGAIAAEVAAIFGLPPAMVAPDVDEILARFTDSGLVHSVAGQRPQTELLVRCIRTAIGVDGGDPVGDLFEDVDWAYLIQAALQDGVMPLLYQSLRVHDHVPEVVLDRLRRHYRANLRWNVFRTRELLEVLALFEAHRIPAMPLKGPVLAACVYGNVGMRQFGDLDIFVPEDRVAQTRTLLATRGYRFRSSGESDLLAERSTRHGTVSIDLQWALAPKRFRYPLDLPSLWARLEPVSLGNATVWQPAPADQVLMLCAHAAKHCWSGLSWLVDIAAFIRRQGSRLDWRDTVERASRSGGERILLVGLRLASDVFGAEVPVEVIARMREDTAVASLAAEVHQQLLAAPKDPAHFQGSRGEVKGGLFYMRSRERLRDKVPYARHLAGRPFRRLTTLIVPNLEDRAALTLPKSLTLLYYVIRPIRLARKHGARLVRRGPKAQISQQ